MCSLRCDAQFCSYWLTVQLELFPQHFLHHLWRWAIQPSCSQLRETRRHYAWCRRALHCHPLLMCCAPPQSLVRLILIGAFQLLLTQLAACKLRLHFGTAERPPEYWIVLQARMVFLCFCACFVNCFTWQHSILIWSTAKRCLCIFWCCPLYKAGSSTVHLIVWELLSAKYAKLIGREYFVISQLELRKNST